MQQKVRSPSYVQCRVYRNLGIPIPYRVLSSINVNQVTPGVYTIGVIITPRHALRCVPAPPQRRRVVWRGAAFDDAH